MEGDPPMFRYSMELTDGSETGIIPVPDMTEEINKQTRNSRIIDLSMYHPTWNMTLLQR